MVFGLKNPVVAVSEHHGTILRISRHQLAPVECVTCIVIARIHNIQIPRLGAHRLEEIEVVILFGNEWISGTRELYGVALIAVIVDADRI